MYYVLCTAYVAVQVLENVADVEDPDGAEAELQEANSWLHQVRLKTRDITH